MEDPDWMNDFKTPTEDVLMLSSSSSSSASEDGSRKKGGFNSAGTNDLDRSKIVESDEEDNLLITDLIKPGKGRKSRGKGHVESSEGGEESLANSKVGRKAALNAKSIVSKDDSEKQQPLVFMSRRPRGLQKEMEEDEELSPSEGIVSPSQVKADKNGKVSTPVRKGRRVSFSEDDETKVSKTLKRKVKPAESEGGDEDDENVLLSSLVKKDKKRKTSATTTFQTPEIDDFNAELNTVVEGLKSPRGAAGLITLKGISKADKANGDNSLLMTEETALDGDDILSIKEGTTLEGEAEEASVQKARQRASSTLPVFLAEKVHRTKVLLECEGDALDLSGDVGAVGRFCVDSGKENAEDELRLDLKGIMYKTTILPSNTFFVVNVGQTEAKVEAIMNDFMQLRPDASQFEDETVVEGTLEGFSFDLDNDGEPLSTPMTTSAPAEIDADDDKKPKKKSPIKAQKLKKAAKGAKGSRAKATAKGATKKTKAKAKTISKKAPKAKPTTKS